MTGAPPACVLLAEEVWGSPLQAMRSLGAQGVPVHVATVGRGAAVFGRSRWCTSAVDLEPAPPAVLAERLATWLEAEVPGPGPIPLLPLSDRLVEVLHHHRDRFPERFRPALPPAELCDALLDKAASFRLAERAGLEVPPWAEVVDDGDLDAALALALPVAVRPTRWSTTGSMYFKVEVHHDRTALRARLVAALADGAEVVVQEYVDAPDDAVELGILWRSQDRRTTTVVTGRKRRQTATEGGVMVWGEAADRPDVRAAATALLDSTGFTGLGGIEVIRADGHLWFIELNPRLEAIHFLATRAGLDTVLLAYRDLALGEVPAHLPAQGSAAAWVGAAWLQQLRNDPRRWRVALDDRLAFARAPGRIRAVTSWRDPLPGLVLGGRLTSHLVRPTRRGTAR